MKVVKRLSWTIILLCGLIPAVLYALLATTTGSAWIIQQAIKYSGQDIVVSRVSGSLLGEISLNDISLNSPTGALHIDLATLSWRPLDLFEQRLSIASIELQDVHITLIETAIEAAPIDSDQGWQLPAITAPWPVLIDSLTVTDITVTTTSQTFSLARLSLNASLRDSALSVADVLIEQEQVKAELKGALSLQQQYPFTLELVAGSSAEFTDSQLPAGEISGTLSGDLNKIDLNAYIELADYPAATAILNGSVSSLQSKPCWQADVTLATWPLAIAQPWLPAMNFDVASILQRAEMSAAIRVTADRITLSDTQISGLGSNADGLLELTADVTEYMQYRSQPERLQFDLNVIADTMVLPYKGEDIALNSADISVAGSLELYSVALGSHWTFANSEDVSFSLAGIGTMNSLALSEIAVSHATFDAAFTAQLGWLDTPWAAFNITQFVGQLPLFDDTYELLLSGGFGFIDGAISANQVEASVNGTRLTANGALSPNNTLALTLRIPNLESWVDSPYAEAEVELVAGVSGDYLKQLDIAIADLQIDSEQFGQWATQQSSQLALSLDTFNVAGTPLCLHEQRDRNPASICLATELAQHTFTVKVDAKKLPLRLLNRLRENDVAERIWGNVDATADVSMARSNGTISSMSGLFRSENTAFTSLDDNLTSRLREWELRWNGNLDEISGTLQAYVADDMGQVLGDLSLTDVMSSQNLVGSIDLAINDLTLLQWILPDLRYVGASAVANVAVAGSLSHPAFSGAIELVADEIGFAQSGLLLTKVRLALEDHIDKPGVLTLQGQARSGTGWIGLDGEIDLPQRELSLDIDGDSFRAVELAMAQVDVSPDLQVKVANQRIDITGSVTVPYAQINEPDLTSSATVSSDVRLFLNGEPVTEENDSLYPIYANIRVILSDNVSINAYGFQGNVSGSIGLIEEPNRALRASGSIQVAEGNYEIYGQQLEIQRGVLIYNGGAIDNPGLDLRVVRTAASISAAANEQISVGAQVGGTLLAPDFRMFSSPTMQDADILSYLILGRPPGGGGANNLQLQALLLIGSQGTDLIGKRLQETFGFDDFGIDSTADPLDTSFYIGKYLSPKLYVKYGVGLFENTNTFYIRYLLSDKLIIESTTSTEAQGGDILYTIEK